MNKLLTISIAAYNVEKYIKETLESLICENMDFIQVLIVNDGSNDSTAAISKEYEKMYPKTFKLINKENGGYGSTINTGIKNAIGKYFKQLDGDDKFDTENLNLFIEKLKECDADVVYTPYYTWRNDKKIPTYCGLEKYESNDSIEINNYFDGFRKDIVMHSLAYKTELLKKNNIEILEKSFYTDSEYALYPFLYAKTMKVFDIILYMYRMGEVRTICKQERYAKTLYGF